MILVLKNSLTNKNIILLNNNNYNSLLRWVRYVAVMHVACYVCDFSFNYDYCSRCNI